ncbi:autotransporter outer membrane beta-barrel domain-containing protein [Pseudovibrio sp. Ad26]|uniref:autotransporter outer membrane beta-barrel domain-containing protein n=1 Tax=Pseudovibrio sp. Ad26 TaxID=989410 RepID=UPI001AD8B310|nr:autotransporter outer membrane beta-barrel domain-containing protein [Pseudovibrio sp. Ad26]
MFGEAGYRFNHGAVSLEPFAGLAYVHLTSDGYSEAGGVAALMANNQDMDQTFTTIGLRAETRADLGAALGAADRDGGITCHAFDRGMISPLLECRLPEIPSCSIWAQQSILGRMRPSV